MVLRSFGEKKPTIGRDVFVDESAVVIGDVLLKERVSVWPGAVLRADDERIEIGKASAIMDLSFAEAPRDRPVVVGDGCIVSHSARLHGCRIENDCLVGIGAIVLDGATIGNKSVIAAGTLIPPGAKIPPDSFVMGVPGRVTRATAPSDLTWLRSELKALEIKAGKYRAQR